MIKETKKEFSVYLTEDEIETLFKAAKITNKTASSFARETITARASTLVLAAE